MTWEKLEFIWNKGGELKRNSSDIEAGKKQGITSWTGRTADHVFGSIGFTASISVGSLETSRSLYVGRILVLEADSIRLNHVSLNPADENLRANNLGTVA